MSKNIVMQELTASGYEELYPKTNSSEIKINNSNINDFLGGGNSAEDAFVYLANLNYHWWLKLSTENVYGLVDDSNPTFPALTSTWRSDFNRYETSAVFTGYNSEAVKLDTKTGIISYGSGSYCNVTFYNTSDDPISTVGPNDGMVNTTVKQTYSGSAYQNFAYFKVRDQLCEASGLQVSCNWGDKFSYSIRQYSGGNAKKVEVVGTQPTYTYVSSPNPSAYPDNGATQDGAQYWYIGQPFTYLPRLGKVEVGSYVGTGISSWGITFENTPQFVHISSNTAPNNQVGFWINPKQVLNYWARSNSQSTISSILSEKTLSCSSSTAAMNDTNTTYQYFAITQ